MNRNDPSSTRWYDGITRYQWLVLLIASLGWIFDVFEGQIFVASMNESMKELVPAADGTNTTIAARDADIAKYNNVAFAAFLVGGTLGGVLFGMLSDRIGRVRTMGYTILMYSLFTCVTALAQTWWQMAALRFLVAMGVGGEWAVASSLVAEVFPARARAWSGAIFHASSVFGTYLAIAAGVLVVGNPDLGWRAGFLVGVFPALLVAWVRLSLREPDTWTAQRQERAQNRGRLSELFRGELRTRTLVGVGLAAAGLATFWGVHIYGKDLVLHARQQALFSALPDPPSEAEQRQILEDNKEDLKDWEMFGMFLVTTGGGLGLVAFGPLCEWLGRRGAFLAYYLGGGVSAIALFQGADALPFAALLTVLPVFGFLTLGMHAGYAVYFPEMFPTRLRGTGAGVCFNVGRLVAAPVLLLNGLLRDNWGLSLVDAASLLSLLFFAATVLLLFAPETRGQELPE